MQLLDVLRILTLGVQHFSFGAAMTAQWFRCCLSFPHISPFLLGTSMFSMRNIWQSIQCDLEFIYVHHVEILAVIGGLGAQAGSNVWRVYAHTWNVCQPELQIQSYM